MTEQRINGKLVRLQKGDVTDLEVEAFVFYAVENLVLGSGYGTAIAVRGGPAVQEECRRLAPIRVGEAVVTGAGEMKATYLIHAVGPKFQEEDEEPKLRRTMMAVLRTAEEKGIKQLAFPPMGTGFYQIPVEMCARVMIDTIREHLAGPTGLEEVVICLRDTREVGPFAARLEGR